jgi:histidinol-phosphate/aromatic aminotransferase/cobyric acid decarboxylase-like protein
MKGKGMSEILRFGFQIVMANGSVIQSDYSYKTYSEASRALGKKLASLTKDYDETFIIVLKIK